MPLSVVDIDATVEAAALPQPTMTDPAIAGTAEEAPPDAEFGESNRYTSAAEVADDYGEDSDVYAASQAIDEMGASYWYVMVLEAVEETEDTLNDEDTVENTPILGDHDVDSPDGDIAFTTDDPPDHEDYDEDIVINADTGEISTSEADIELTYHHADFTLLDELPGDANRFAMADRRMTRQHIGVLDTTISWCSANGVHMVAAGPNVNEYDDIDEAMEVAHDIAAYVPSGDLMMTVDGSSTDLAAYKLGLLATNEPWFDPFWKEIPAGEPISRNVGHPSIEETFEGGDEEGRGPVNAVIAPDGTNILSNSLTTAGASSDYQFFDIGTTQTYTVAELDRALTSLRRNRNRIPFADPGETMIESTAIDTLNAISGSVDDPLAEFDVRVPEWDAEDVDPENRIWGGIQVDARLSGNVHEFGVKLNLSV